MRRVIFTIFLPGLLCGNAEAFPVGYSRSFKNYDYCVRTDGTAADKSTATDCTAAATSMNEAVFNGETFADLDVVVFSSRGGGFNTGVSILSSGSDSSNKISYIGEPGHLPTWSGGEIVVHASNVILRDLINSAATNSNFEFGDGVNTYTGVETYNLTAENSTNQSFQHLDGVTVVHNNLACSGAADECVSLHNDNAGVADPHVTINGITIVGGLNGFNWVGSPTLHVYDFNITGITGLSIQPANNGGDYIFEKGYIEENVDLAGRVIDCTYGAWRFANIVFKNLTDGDYYMLARSTVSSFDLVSSTFMGDGVNTTTAVFNQYAGKYKDNAFVNTGTESYYGTAGTIDHNLYYGSGTARGTNTVSGTDPNFSATGHIQSTASAAYDTGIGPGSDADIPTDDIDGDARSGATCDIGADEYVQ